MGIIKTTDARMELFLRGGVQGEHGLFEGGFVVLGTIGFRGSPAVLVGKGCVYSR